VARLGEQPEQLAGLVCGNTRAHPEHDAGGGNGNRGQAVRTPRPHPR
jgi:hypothetical protein